MNEFVPDNDVDADLLKTKPGIADFVSHPQDLSAYLQPLMAQVIL